MNLEKGYSIKSPNCGRDEKGVFHCTCGKCKPLPTEIDEEGDDNGSDRIYRGKVEGQGGNESEKPIGHRSAT